MSSLKVSASVDRASGEVYVPPRRFAADGSLRVCDDFSMAAQGVLRAVTEIGGQAYGLVDMDHDVRVQVRISGTDQAVGHVYEGHLAAGTQAVDDVAQIGDIEFHRA